MREVMAMKRFHRGFTLIEVAVTVAILAVVVAIALPSFMMMRMASNEGAVLGGVRAVVQACDSYQMQGTQGGVGEFPLTLRLLTRANPPYLDGRFNGLGFGNAWRDYSWTYVPGPQRQRGVGNLQFQFRDTYTLRVDPVRRGVDGQRSFYVDQTGVIRFNTAGPAGPNDTPVEQAEN